MIIKKAVFEASIAGLLCKLSGMESVDSLSKALLEYRGGLKNADKLNANQQIELASAKELLASEKQECIDRFGLAAWQAISANADGTEIQKAKAAVQSLDGDSTAMRNAFVLANAPKLLGIDADVPKHISANGIVQLGAKAKRNSSSANGERLSLRNVPAGMNFWYKYSGIWYQIIGTSTGIRLFNLDTRIEVTDLDDLPENASAAQKMIMGWADAFRGYVSVCPSDVTALTSDELMVEKA